mgnify:CR=1 FL=1
MKKVLVIDDTAEIRMIIEETLRMFGFEPVMAEDGEEGVKMAKLHHPDLIIMDIQLPEVSGLDLTRWIKDDAAINQIPIMAVTAFAMRQDERLVREAGCEAYMSKPIQMTAFINEVKKLTSPRGAGQPPRNATPPPTRRVAR